MKFDVNKAAKDSHQFDKRKKDLLDRGRMKVNDLIAPDAMETDVNHIKIGNRYLRTLIVTGYPRTSHIGWLNRIYAYGANIDITNHIEPLPTEKVIKTLNRKIGQYVSTQRMDIKNGKITDISVETARNDAEELRDALHKGRERLFYQTLYINVAGKNLEELDEITADIESLCGGVGLTTRHAMFQQEQAFKTILPIGTDLLRYKRNFDTSSLATCLPIVSAELTDTKGTPILYGLNMINGSLVLFDRFSLNNYNSVTLATSGAGKSYFVKLEAIRYMALGVNVIIIDPQGEYKRIAEALGGQYVKISANSTHRINPLDLEITEEEEGGNYLQAKALDLLSIIEVMIRRELVARERKIVLDAVERTYAKYGITKDSKSVKSSTHIQDEMFQLEGSKKKMPTLQDLEQMLRQYGEEGITVADELEPFTSGFLDLFNGETNVDPSSSFLVFDVKDMEKELAELAMFITLEFIWNKIKRNDGKKRMLVVDEAWKMMNSPQSARYIVQVAKTARKFHAGLSIVSQQAKDFLENGGDGIIGNTSMQILLKQHQNDMARVAEMFGLSRAEQNFLRTASPGEALVFAGGNHTAVQVTSSQFEHILCTTNPADLEKIKNLL